MEFWNGCCISSGCFILLVLQSMLVPLRLLLLEGVVDWFDFSIVRFLVTSVDYRLFLDQLVYCPNLNESLLIFAPLHRKFLVAEMSRHLTLILRFQFTDSSQSISDDSKTFQNFRKIDRLKFQRKS